MEFQQLRYVIAVAEEGSFTRAAHRCHVVQSALSHQIKALEHELGVRLFARTSRRVELTASGDAFLTAARSSLAAAERAATDAAAAAGHLRGTLVVGMIPTVTALDIPAALSRFHRTHPEVAIHLQLGSSDAFMTGIAGGEIDVAVLGLPDSSTPTGVTSRVLAREQLAAVVPARHRLARRRKLTLADLAEESFADFPSGAPGRMQSDRAFHQAGIARHVPFEAATAELILDLVRHELAVAMLPPAVVPATPELVTVPVTAGPTRIQYLAWSRFNPTPAAQAFLAGLPEGD